MSTSMTGYDTSATVYPTPQYGYEGEISWPETGAVTASLLCSGDPRQAGWGGVQYQPAHHGQGLPGQGSPSERYNYYDNR